MKKRALRTPSYCLHKATGQAVVRIDGKDYYLGKYGTPESRAAYDRTIAEWLANGRCLAPKDAADALTVTQLLQAYEQHAQHYYRNEHGEPGRELENIRLALEPLRRLYGPTPAAGFGPLALRAVQQDLVQAGLSRTTVNARVNRLRRAFKWAVSYQLLPPGVYEALRTVPGLQRGRCQAREADPIMPVPVDVVEATLPFAPAPVAAMARLQLLSCCRPGEVMQMRAIDLTMSGPDSTWTYRPARHKNQHRGLDRVIYLGPRAQEVIKPFLTTDLEAYLFSPRAYVEALHRRRAEQRQTKRTPSELRRKRQATPKRKPAERYDRRSYRLAILRAVDKANRERARQGLPPLPRWSPLQLRHTAATRVASQFGVEAARVVLGHAKVETTQIYAERDLARGAQIAAEVG
jgi:integrase